MRKFVVAAVFLGVVGCATAPTSEPAPAPTPAPDPRIGEMQTAMTELLERMDVLNDRIAKLEEGAPASSPAGAAASRAAAPEEGRRDA
ncbi:MAG TPA: hypothetical protein VJZ00_14235, partial [Thermoanaerobaculia bacterium]|nr:hypothetical protein [Thermoanaerobaculia bacterium]